MWRTIDNLTSSDLHRRGEELRRCLENFSDNDLILFYDDAVKVFLLLFSPRIYRLYCAAFAGEANGSGLTDFCSNIILSGRPLVEAVLLDADNFAEVTNMESFNQDTGIDVSSIAWHILVDRYDEDSVAVMFRRGGVQPLEGIWEELETQVGRLTFEPDWRVAEATMPRICARRKYHMVD